jgi:hypothetical protein
VLADVTAAEVDIIVDALNHYQLVCIGEDRMKIVNSVIVKLLVKLTKGIPEID